MQRCSGQSHGSRMRTCAQHGRVRCSWRRLSVVGRQRCTLHFRRSATRPIIPLPGGLKPGLWLMASPGSTLPPPPLPAMASKRRADGSKHSAAAQHRGRVLFQSAPAAGGHGHQALPGAQRGARVLECLGLATIEGRNRRFPPERLQRERDGGCTTETQQRRDILIVKTATTPSPAPPTK